MQAVWGRQETDTERNKRQYRRTKYRKEELSSYLLLPYTGEEPSPTTSER